MFKVTKDGDLCIYDKYWLNRIESSTTHRFFDISSKNIFFSIQEMPNFTKLGKNYIRVSCYTRFKLLPYFKKVIDFYHWEFTLENENTEY